MSDAEPELNPLLELVEGVGNHLHCGCGSNSWQINLDEDNKRIETIECCKCHQFYRFKRTALDAEPDMPGEPPSDPILTDEALDREAVRQDYAPEPSPTNEERARTWWALVKELCAAEALNNPEIRQEHADAIVVRKFIDALDAAEARGEARGLKQAIENCAQAAKAAGAPRRIRVAIRALEEGK